MADLQKAAGNEVCKIGLGPCMKSKWLKKNKDTIVKADPSKVIQDETACNLRLLQSSGSGVSDEEVKNLKRRKLVNQVVRKSYKVLKGAEYNPIRRRRIADLTKEMFGNKAEVREGELQITCIIVHMTLLLVASCTAPFHGIYLTLSCLC